MLLTVDAAVIAVLVNYDEFRIGITLAQVVVAFVSV